MFNYSRHCGDTGILAIWVKVQRIRLFILLFKDIKGWNTPIER